MIITINQGDDHQLRILIWNEKPSSWFFNLSSIGGTREK